MQARHLFVPCRRADLNCTPHERNGRRRILGAAYGPRILWLRIPVGLSEFSGGGPDRPLVLSVRDSALSQANPDISHLDCSVFQRSVLLPRYDLRAVRTDI